MSTESFTAAELKDIQYDANIRVNFLESRLLKGGPDSLKAALLQFSNVVEQYTFHAVGQLLTGYLYGRLEENAKRETAYTRTIEMMKSDDIRKAYGRYLDWDTAATNDFRQWQAGQPV